MQQGIRRLELHLHFNIDKGPLPVNFQSIFLSDSNYFFLEWKAHNIFKIQHFILGYAWKSSNSICITFNPMYHFFLAIEIEVNIYQPNILYLAKGKFVYYFIMDFLGREIRREIRIRCVSDIFLPNFPLFHLEVCFWLPLFPLAHILPFSSWYTCDGVSFEIK